MKLLLLAFILLLTSPGITQTKKAPLPSKKLSPTKKTPPNTIGKAEHLKKLKTKDNIFITTSEGKKDEGIVSLPVDEKSQEEEATFPGGIVAWRKYLGQNLNVDTLVSSGAPPGIYTVIIQFLVDQSGNISDIKSLTTNGYNSESEAIRIIKKSPNWVPALVNGRRVTSYRKQPIIFVITEEK